ncbi:MAG: ATP-binding cassette domain-containing protein [Tepidiformaceae bacterium]
MESTIATASDVNSGLVMRGISKRYGVVQALHQVNFEVLPGEIHALVGENGSGKSTLLGIAVGSRATDSGSVEVAGQPLTDPSPSLAHDLGICLVYQDNSHVQQYTAAQNMYLAASPARRPAYRQRNAWAQEAINRYGINIRATDVVASLSAANQQFLELIKALVREPKVLLLDEPTTALAPTEVAQLMAIVRKAATAGMAIVYVSHRLPEVIGIANRISVLRDGEHQGTWDNKDIDQNQLVSLMVGVPVELEFPPKSILPEQPEVALSIEELSGKRFGPISFSLRRGEVLGIAGAEGNGQRELVRAIAGLEHFSGRVLAGGSNPRTGSVQRAIRSGIMMLSGNRREESIFPEMGVRENMTIQVLNRFGKLGFISGNKERAAAQGLVDRLAVATPSLDQQIQFLSGGNQQKAVIARAFLLPSKVLLVDEPTQGVDAAARLDIYRALRERAAEGSAVIVNSSDAAELEGLCDRVIVLSRGRAVQELGADELTEKNIVAAFLTSTNVEDATLPIHQEETTLAALRRHAGRIFTADSIPLALLALLMVGLGLYTNAKNSAFLSDSNIRFMLINLIPIALVSIAQLNVLLVAGFDVSVGSVMSLVAVTASVLLKPDDPAFALWVGTAVILSMGVAVGLINGILVRGFNLAAIIATIATLTVVQGIALKIRPSAGKPINFGFTDMLQREVGNFPIALFGVLALVVLYDLWLYRTASGMKMRAVGFRQESARRNGINVDWIHIRAYILSAFIATVAGFFLSAQIGNGDPTGGSNFILKSFSACVLGGASLFGGRGTFGGAMLGALLLTEIDKMPAFLEIDRAFGQMLTGGLTLVAILLYSSGFARIVGRAIPRRRSRPTASAAA